MQIHRVINVAGTAYTQTVPVARNHPVLHVTHGKGGRNTVLKAVAIAKSSHGATVL